MDARIRILLRVIDERGGVLPLSSKQIGSLLGIGDARVLRLFSAEVGKTLRRYLLEVRMARAAGLLRDTLLPIKTIASNCGYAEVTNFYRDFKNVYGTSPRRLRLMHMVSQLHDKNCVLLERPVFGQSGTLDDDRAA